MTHVDARTAFEAWLAPRKDLLATIALRGTYLDAEDVNRLLALSLPGIDEVAALLEIVRLSASAYQRVIVDTAPTGHTLRLLTMPTLYARVAELLDALQSHHRGVVRALTGRYRQDDADRLIASLAADAAGLMARLRDGRLSRFVWVTLPEPMALEETADAIDALHQSGISVSTLVVNRTAPPGGCAWDAARRRFEARALAPLQKRFTSIEMRTVAEMPAEPRSVIALDTIAASCRQLRLSVRPPVLARRLHARLPVTAASLVSATALDARWLLFGGKGGVGKTTCSAAVALDLARVHPRDGFLLLSTDPAHSVGDALGARVSDRARAVAGAPSNLDVREIDAAAGFERFRTRYIDTVDAVFDGLARGADTGGERSTFRELIDLAPPGVDEVMAIADVAELLTKERAYRTIVVDTAPTGHALRLLETPGVLREWAKALMAVLLKYREVVRAGEFAQLLVNLSKRLRSLEATLRDRSQTGFVIVTRAAAAPREETVGLRESLERLGVAVRALIVNAVGAGTCARCRAIVGQERRELRMLGAPPGRAPYAIIVAPSALPPPHGAAALLEWRSRWRAIES